MKWQPIETAPKDGTPILGYFESGAICAGCYYFYPEGKAEERPEYMKDPAYVVDFVKDEDLWVDYGESADEGFHLTCPAKGYADQDVEFNPPTHWMPLPQPPEAE